jgi:glycosyltransferase involved in cell wall biosynthesis
MSELWPMARRRPWTCLFRYRSVELRIARFDALRRPAGSYTFARLLTVGRAVAVDDGGNRRSIGLRLVLRSWIRLLRDRAATGALLAQVNRTIEGLERRSPAHHVIQPGRPLYVRSDLSFGLGSGGSVGHVAGVANALEQVAGSPPIYLGPDWAVGLAPEIRQVSVAVPGQFWDIPELPELAFNTNLAQEVDRLLANEAISFVYHRYGLDSFGVFQTSPTRPHPVVLEYNGSESWIGREWGGGLRHPELAERIERLVLERADLIVVVSSPMRDELVARGVADTRILVNPNGVDVDRYHPAIDGNLVKERLGLSDCLVVGFIGTFSPWHGAEILVASFSDLMRRRPDLRDRVRLLMIGGGPRLAASMNAARDGAPAGTILFTGPIPQAEGPLHLAACDVLVSPHVPNADGSPFFGAPTKLFEYMAMGRAIVASRLDQIGEVLDDGATALLVPPSSVDATSAAIERLLEDPGLRARLGEGARAAAVERHTWLSHTRRIVERLQSVTEAADG